MKHKTGGGDAIPADPDLHTSLVAQRSVATAHREPLRESLRWRAAETERNHRAARVDRLRDDPSARDHEPEARRAHRAQLDAAPRAVLREHGVWRRQAD